MLYNPFISQRFCVYSTDRRFQIFIMSSDSCKTCASKGFSPPCSNHVSCMTGVGALRRFAPLDCSLCRELLHRRDAHAVAYLQHLYVVVRTKLRSNNVSPESAYDFFLSDEHKRADLAVASYPRSEFD